MSVTGCATPILTANQILTRVETVDGTGSLLDADFLDGYTSSEFARVSADNVWTGANSFLDNKFSLLDNGDGTKVLQFQVSGISAGTTRTLTVPNASSTIAVLGLAQTFTENQTVASSDAHLAVDANAPGSHGYYDFYYQGTRFFNLASTTNSQIEFSDVLNSVQHLVFHLDTTAATAYITCPLTKDAASPSSASIVLSGGIGIAKSIYVGDTTNTETLIVSGVSALDGAINRAILLTTIDVTISDIHCVILADTTAGSLNITLPASPPAGRHYVVKNVGTGANTLTVVHNGHNIDGAASDISTVTPGRGWALDFESSYGWATT